MSELVESTIAEGVASIVINDGKVNVMNDAMLAALIDAVARARQAGAIILLRSGAPRAFTAGFDMKTLGSGDLKAARRLLEAGARLLLNILEHPHPVITVCEAHAYPMGAFILLASDLRIGARGDYRIGLNEVAIGIAVPDFALALVQSRVPANLAPGVAGLGRMLSPQEALAAGFLDVLVEPQHVSSTVESAIAEFRSVNHAAHASTKRRLRAETIRRIEASIAGEILPVH